MMNCYLCQSSHFIPRPGSVRDQPSLGILECVDCGLVQLSSKSHIQDGHYEGSGMHGREIISVEQWLADSTKDDSRRFEMMKTKLPRKRLLDFGCGAGGFLCQAKTLTSEVTGVEPVLS